MTYSIKSEEELAKELASRGVSPFTEVRNSHISGRFPYELVMAMAFLIIHILINFNVYAVQFSRITGNYAETEATVVHMSSRRVKHECDLDDHDCRERISIVYSIDAVADDGTEFHFSGNTDYGGEGSRIRVKYSKSNPRLAYVDVGFSDRIADILVGVVMLAIVAFFARLASLVFKRNRNCLRWNQECQMVAARGLYLPVLETCGYEERTEDFDDCDSIRYAPVYRYAMPDGTELLFQGLWTRNKPKGELANHHTEFRVYMMDPEDHNDNRYFIEEIPRQGRWDPGV